MRIPGGKGSRGLTLLLRLTGVVAIVAGTLTIVTGSGTLPAAGTPSASVESELRFYATWWVGAGVFVLWLAPRAVAETGALRTFSALLFVAGCSRLLAAADAGRPSDGQVVLMVVELLLPIVLVAWQAAAGRAQGLGGRDRA